MTKPAVKKIVLASRPKGLPTRKSLRLEEAPTPDPPQGRNFGKALVRVASPA